MKPASHESRPLKILFFLNSPVRAGVEEVVLALVQGLDRKQFEVHLAAPPELLQSFQRDLAGVDVRTFPLHLRSFRQWADIRRLLSYLREQKIQVVNSHLFYATLFAAPIARLAGVPVVIETTHGPETWRTSWFKKKAFLDRFIETMVTANVAVSEANRKYLADDKRYPRHKLHVIPNGRPLAAYESVPESELAELRRRFSLSHHHRVVAVVARLEPQKGHRYLLDALPAVIARYPGLRVLFVGDGSLRDELTARAAELGLVQVIFAGFQTNVRSFYQLSEFIALPSLYEGMPLTAIEAGAASRALVATAVDGTCEVIVHGQTGLLVPVSSPDALAGAMMDLLGHPEKSRTLGQNARRRVEEIFSLDRQIQTTAEFYLKYSQMA